MSSTARRDFLIVAYAGHRNLSDSNAVAASIERVLDDLEHIAAQSGSKIVAVGSAARGADALFLESFKRRGHFNLLKMPFAIDSFERDAPNNERERILGLIEMSNAVEYADGRLDENEAYYEAGLQTIESADVLAAVWNSLPALGKGGTADVIQAAEGMSLPVIRIDASTGSVDWPADFAKEEPPDAMSRDEHPSNEPITCDRAWLDRKYQRYDTDATEHAPRTRLLVFRVILLHLLASAVSITAVMLRLHGLLEQIASIFEGAALVWALVLATAHRRRSQAWLDARYRAELCRSFQALWSMRRDALLRIPPVTVAGALETFRRELEIAWRLCARDAKPLNEAAAAYSAGRLNDQRTWMARKADEASSLKRKLHGVAVATTVTAICCGATAFLIGLIYGNSEFQQWLKLCSMVLPLAAAALFSFIISYDLARRSDRYRELEQKLASLDKRVKVSATWPSLTRVVSDAEAILMNELGEWHAMQRFTGRPH